MKSEIKETTAELATKARNGVDMAQDAVNDSVDSLSKRLRSLESIWNEYGDAIVKNAKELGSVAEKQVRSNPLAAFGIAFGAGILAARLLRR
jgi:ElaB/YqjD/DUF883 family membrane-anchored ribosome-binding protein